MAFPTRLNQILTTLAMNDVSISLTKNHIPISIEKDDVEREIWSQVIEMSFLSKDKVRCLNDDLSQPESNVERH